MKKLRALAVICLVMAWFGSAIAAAQATEESPTTTVAEAEAADPDAPPDPNAPPVIVEEVTPELEEEPWTARFLAPATAVLGIVVFVLVVAYYFVRVRGRYEIVG
jgi:hypothetical protein